MLVLAPTAESRALLQPLIESNHVVLQDKSSCFSAYCMVQGYLENSDEYDDNGAYLDACAAPGNKTCHLAMLLASKSNNRFNKSPPKKSRKKTGSAPPKTITVHALDKSHDRFQLLQRRMKDLVPSAPMADVPDVKVVCHQKDFLQTAPDDFPTSIRAIMLDPSCSGSGMTKSNHRQYLALPEEASSSKNGSLETSKSSMEMLLDPSHSNSRIQSLCGFQLKALTHAATAFPTVRKIVYSTCSPYKAENERLVNLFLEENGNDWKLIAPKCLAAWERRGLAEDTRSSTTDVDLPKTPLTDAEKTMFDPSESTPSKMRPTVSS